MKKKLKKIIASLLLISNIQLFGSLAFAEKLEQMPYDEDNSTAYSNAIQSNDFDIFVLDNSNVILPDVSIQFKKADNLDKIKTDKSYKSIWITPSIYTNLINNDSWYEKLNKYLDHGYSLYFLGLTDLNILSNKFIGSSANETITNGYQQTVSYVSKNSEGEYFFGHYFSDKPYNDKNVIKDLVTSTWNRRNDIHYTRKNKDSIFSNLFAQKVEASSGSSFSIGSSWSCKFGWNQYNFSVTDRLGYFGTIGNYTEWKAGYYLTNPVDGKDYYAIAMESCMAPTSTNYTSDYLRVRCPVSNNASGQLLRDYAPKQGPSSSTFSFNIGSNFSKTGPSGSIGASWSTSISDLSLLDSSQPSSQTMDIKFSYNWDWGFTSYGTHTSWQNSCIICQGSSGSSSATIDNERYASFAEQDPYTYAIATSMNQMGMYSTISK